MSVLTRIKNNQITDTTITGSKLVTKTITSGLLEDNLTYGSNLTVSGNLTVNGTTTTVDTTNTVIADPLLVLSRGETGTPSVDSGLIIERGTSSNVGIIWDESADVFAIINTTEDGTTAGNITISSYANFKAADLESATASLGNIDISSNAITSTDTNGDINLTPNGSGEVVASTLSVSDLTSGRVVLAGASGALNDSANLTFNGSTLVVTGVANISTNLNVSGEATLASATISDLTSGRVVLAGTSGAVEDSANLTFNGSTLAVTGAATVSTTLGVTGATTLSSTLDVTGLASLDGGIDVDGAFTVANTSGNIATSGTLGVTGESTLASATVSDLTSGRVVLAGTSGAIEDSGNLTFDGSTLTVTGDVSASGDIGGATATVSGNATVGGTLGVTGESTLASATISDLTSGRVVLAGTAGAIEDSANLTFNGSTLAVTGAATISTTLGVTGESTLASATVSDLTSGRVVLAGTAGAIEDSGNLTFNGTTLTTTKVTVDNISIDGNTISSVHSEIIIDPSTAGAGGTVIIQGNLQVTGTTTQVDSTVVTIADPLFQLGADSNDNLDRGITALYNDGTAKTAFFGLDDSAGEFVFIYNATDSSSVISGSLGNAAFGSLRVTDLTDNRILIAGASGEVEDSANLTFDGTDLTVSSAVVSDLTSGRVVLAGTSGAIEDSANLTFNGTTLAVTGAATISTTLGVTGNTTVGGTLGVTGESTLASATVSDLTSGRVVLAGTSGAIEDSGNLTFNGTTLTITGDVSANGDLGGATATVSGNATVGGTLGVTGESTLASATVSDLTSGRVVLAGTAGAIEDSGNLTFNGTTLTTTAAAIDNVSIDGNTVTTSAGGLTIDSFTGETTINDNATVTGTLDVTGATALSSTLGVTGESTLASATVSDLTSGRVVLAGTAGAIEDSANLTFSSNTLTVSGSAVVDNVTIDGNSITSSDNLTFDAAASGAIVVNEAGADVDIRMEASSQANALFIEGSTGNIGIRTATPTAGAAITINTTDSLIVPNGTTAQRPGTPATAMLRYNSSLAQLEFYNGTEWKVAGAEFTIITADSFSGDGSTVAFTLSEDATSAGLLVAINGVLQDPGTAYSVSGTTLTFTEAPATGDNIDSRIIVTTTEVVNIGDGDTSIAVDDTAQTATTTINGNVVMTVTNAAVVPGANVTYDLGTSSLRWKDLYLSGTTLALGDLRMKDAGSGVLGIYQSDGTTPATLSSDNVDTTTIANGTSNVAVVSTNGNIDVDVAGTNVATFTATGADLKGVPIAPTATAGTNTTQIATTAFVSTAVSNLLDGAPAALDTLNELAAAINDDASFSSTVTTALGNRLSSTATVTLTGDVTGTANFSANTASISATIAANSVALGTDTTGNYVAAGAVSGNGLSGSASAEGATFTVTSNATSANTGSTIVFRDASGNFSAGTITATATNAQYADLAENYTADAEYAPGTVVSFGGDAEVTVNAVDADRKVAGVISTNPAHLMNATCEGKHVVALALQGRVPCMVVGAVEKGDLMVAAGNGYARAEADPKVGTVIGKALEAHAGGEGVIEVAVGRF